jgi:hypothetical protein
MKIRTLMTAGFLVAGLGTMAQAQSYYAPGPYNNPVGRDLHQRAAIEQRVEADRCAIARERAELRYAPGYAVRHEARELNSAQWRLQHDERALHAVNRDLRYDAYGRRY